jgi:hypothetical protein
VCAGLRSIISRWSWRVAIAVALETPGGSGVIVVKVVRFDMLTLILDVASSIMSKEGRQNFYDSRLVGDVNVCERKWEACARSAIR